MSESRRVAEVAKALGDSDGPVSGRARHCERASAVRRGSHSQSALASRREAVLRILMEAYRRDVGPGACDAR